MILSNFKNIYKYNKIFLYFFFEEVPQQPFFPFTHDLHSTSKKIITIFVHKIFWLSHAVPSFYDE